MTVVNVLYFAGLRERIGSAQERLDLPQEQTEASIVRYLCARYPDAVELLTRSRVACDDDFMHGVVVLHAEAEVSIIPPVSGG